MSIRASHLAIRRPSPTTVRFTVSDAASQRNVSTRIIFYVTCLLRIVIGLWTALLLLVKYGCDVDSHDSVASTDMCPPWLLEDMPVVVAFANRYSWQLVAPVSLTVLYLCFRRFYTEESLLVLRTLGIQTSTTSSTYLSTSTTRFIPTSQIQDIFIHEAFKGFEVHYYLAIVVQDEGEVVVVFPNLLPKLAIVEQVWKEARACLFEPKS